MARIVSWLITPFFLSLSVPFFFFKLLDTPFSAALSKASLFLSSLGGAWAALLLFSQGAVFLPRRYIRCYSTSFPLLPLPERRWFSSFPLFGGIPPQCRYRTLLFFRLISHRDLFLPLSPPKAEGSDKAFSVDLDTALSPPFRRGLLFFASVE